MSKLKEHAQVHNGTSSSNVLFLQSLNMSRLDLGVLVEHLNRCYPDEEPSEFTDTSFDLLAIVGHRNNLGSSEYNIRWRPSRLAKIHLLTGTIQGRPLRDGIAKVFQALDREDRVRVIWKDRWVPAKSVLDCGELLHEFWTEIGSNLLGDMQPANVETY